MKCARQEVICGSPVRRDIIAAIDHITELPTIASSLLNFRPGFFLVRNLSIEKYRWTGISAGAYVLTKVFLVAVAAVKLRTEARKCGGKENSWKRSIFSFARGCQVKAEHPIKRVIRLVQENCIF